MATVRFHAVLVGGLLVLAGCGGTSPFSAPPANDGTSSPVEQTPTAYPSVPYELGVDNTGNDRSHQVSVVFYRLENGSRGDAVFDETMTVGADELVTRDITFPTAGEYFVVIGLDGEVSATHRYEVRAGNPESAVVIGIKGDGTVMVATFQY